MKTTWTVLWLCAWADSAPAGIKTVLVVAPGQPIQLIMGDEGPQAIHRLPATWRPWRYYARLGAAARILCEDAARVRRRLDAAHDAFCRGLSRDEGGARR